MSETQAPDVGALVRSWREFRELTLRDLSTRTGLSVQMLWNLEHGVGSVRLNSLATVFEALGLELEVSVRPMRPMRLVRATPAPVVPE